jgi:hypothetical protein
MLRIGSAGRASRSHAHMHDTEGMINTSSESKPCAAAPPVLGWHIAPYSGSCVSWPVPKRSTSIGSLAVQLVEAAGLRDACDLDLLLFFSRHPRVVLSSEQLAAYVGYDLVEVARGLDLLLDAGLLKRTVNHGAPRRMYVLEVDHAETWLEPLRQVCATPDGRHALRALLRERALGKRH